MKKYYVLISALVLASVLTLTGCKLGGNGSFLQNLLEQLS